MCVSEICCHRRGASRDFERSRFTSRDHSGVPVVQNHWQSVESAAFRSWPFKIPSARVEKRRPARLTLSRVATSLFFRSATRLFFFERFILSSPGGIANRHGEPPIECRPRHAFAAGDSRKPVTEHRLGGQPVGKARSFPMTEEDRGSASGSRGC